MKKGTDGIDSGTKKVLRYKGVVVLPTSADKKKIMLIGRIGIL